MHPSDDLRQIQERSRLAEMRRSLWSMLAVGLAVGYIGMHLAVVRPLQRQMDGLHGQISTLEQGMEQLAGVRDNVWKTNTLLSSLATQQKQVDHARQALQTISRFRTDVESEAARTAAAQTALADMGSLQGRLIDSARETTAAGEALAGLTSVQERLQAAAEGSTRAVTSLEGMLLLQDMLIGEEDRIDLAARSLDRAARLHGDIVAEGESVEPARRALAEIVGIKQLAQAEVLDAGLAESALRRLGSLKQTLVEQAEGLSEARQTASGLIALKSTIHQESDDLESAREAADELLVLKDQLVVRGAGTHTASQNADRLFTLRDRLASTDGAQLETAETNLGGLIEMQGRLAAETDQLADALLMIETISDLQQELKRHVSAFQGIRRDLVELMLLENSIAQAVRVVEPLISLSNLRRLNPEDVRAAARDMLERRQTRQASRTPLPALRDSEPVDPVVPLPPADDN